MNETMKTIEEICPFTEWPVFTPVKKIPIKFIDPALVKKYYLCAGQMTPFTGIEIIK